jgi:DNA-binding response OmpR family regulator
MENKKPIVLVAEDDEFMLKVHKKKMDMEGFEVLLARNGQEALDMARAKKPDIILLDIIMPVKDGFEALKEFKADPELKKIKVVVLSNLGQEEDKMRAADMGAADYFVKANVSFQEIISITKRHLGIQ